MLHSFSKYAALLALAVVSAFTLSGCSPSSLFGTSKDSGVLEQPSYRKVNTACAGLDLSSSEMDGPTFKKVINCFNSNGGVDPIARLINRMSDKQVESITKVANQYLLTNQKRLYEVDRTYQALSDRKILDSSIVQLGTLLKNKEFISSSLALLKSGYFSSEGTPDRRLLKALEKLSPKVSAENMADLIDAGLALSSAPAFNLLQDKFRGPSPAQRSTDQIVSSALLYLQNPLHIQYNRELLRDAMEGQRLFNALDRAVGVSSEELKDGVPRMSASLMASLAPGSGLRGDTDSTILDDMNYFFSFMSRPMKCMRGTHEVKNPSLFVAEEMAKHDPSAAAGFLVKYNYATLVAMNPFCDYPQELAKYYPVLTKYADYQIGSSSAFEPVAKLLKGAYDNNIHELFLKIISDRGGYGLEMLFPALKEIADRGALTDLLFTINLPTMAARADIVNFSRFVTDNDPALGNVSIYDVFSDSLVRMSPYSMIAWVKAIDAYIEDANGNATPPILQPALTVLREAYYVNEVHPFLSLVHDVLADASKNPDFFDTLLQISDYPEFAQTIGWISANSSNGQLKELLGASITLFHKFAMQGGSGEIPVRRAPEFNALSHLRHQLDSSSANQYVAALVNHPEEAACKALDIGLPMDQYWAPAYSGQIHNLAACIDNDGQHDGVKFALEYLYDQKTAPPGDVKPFLGLNIDMIKVLANSLDQGNSAGDHKELSDLVDRWTHTVDNGKFNSALAAVPLLVSTPVHGEHDFGNGSGGVLAPLIPLTVPLVSSEKGIKSLRDLQDYAADVVKRESIPHVLTYAEKLSQATYAESPKQPDAKALALRDNLRKWIRTYECGADVEKRVAEILDDYENAETTWEWIDGRSRRNWTQGDFKRAIDPVLHNLSDPYQNSGKEPLLDAILKIPSFYTLPESEQSRPTENQRYTRKDLIKWLYDRANDPTPMLYFYPGERRPRVRLVNTLDRFELILIGSDFTFILPSNFSLKFLKAIGASWTEVKNGVAFVPDWAPSEIRQKYTHGLPPTLKATYGSMKSYLKLFHYLLGTPKVHRCAGAPALEAMEPQLTPEVESPGLKNLTLKDLEKMDEDPNFQAMFENMPIDTRDHHDDPPPEPHFESPIKNGSTFLNWWVPFWVKASVFNTAQALPVIKENLPDSGYKTAGGMRMFRDLFYEMNRSTPAGHDGMSDGMKNNLSVALKLARIGVLRQIGRAIRNLSPEDPAFESSVNAVISASLAPHLLPAGRALLADRDHALIYKAVNQVFDVIDETPAQVPKLKQLGLYGLALPGVLSMQTDAQGKSLDIIDPVLATAEGVLKDSYPYLVRRTDWLKSALKWDAASDFVHAFHDDAYQNASPLASPEKNLTVQLLQDVLNEPKHAVDALTVLKTVDPEKPDPLAGNIDLFLGRLSALTADGDPYGWDKLGLKQVGKDLLHFLEETPDSGQPRTAAKTREFVSKILQSKMGGLAPSDSEQLLHLAARNPDQFQKLLEVLSGSIQNGEIPELIRFGRCALYEGPKTSVCR